MLTISTRPVVHRPVMHMSRKHMACQSVGMLDGHGYDGQQKDTICDICGPWQMIQSTFKPDFHWFWLIGYDYELLRCLDVEIWRFLWWRRQQTDRLLHPCACAQGNKMLSNSWTALATSSLLFGISSSNLMVSITDHSHTVIVWGITVENRHQKFTM